MFDFGTDASEHEQNFVRYCAPRTTSGKRRLTGRVKTRKRRYVTCRRRTRQFTGSQLQQAGCVSETASP
jgi:hypothetical protein